MTHFINRLYKIKQSIYMNTDKIRQEGLIYALSERGRVLVKFRKKKLVL